MLFKEGLKEFLDAAFGQNVKFDYSETRFKQDGFKVKIIEDVTKLTIDELGYYASLVASYTTYLNDLVSISEAEFTYYEDVAEKFEASLVEEEMSTGTQVTAAKAKVKSNPNLKQVTELYLSSKVKYNSLKRKVESLDKIGRLLSREQARRTVDYDNDGKHN